MKNKYCGRKKHRRTDRQGVKERQKDKEREGEKERKKNQWILYSGTQYQLFAAKKWPCQGKNRKKVT